MSNKHLEAKLKNQSILLCKIYLQFVNKFVVELNLQVETNNCFIKDFVIEIRLFRIEKEH